MNITRWTASALAFWLLTAPVSPTARAASGPLRLTAAQIAKLDIQTASPRAAEHGRISDLPARVVVPPQQSHVVGAPLAGVITLVAVAPSQTVRRGDVLFQLASPALAELRKGAAQADIQLQLARRNAQRDQQLLDEGLIADARFRASQAALAEARVAQAERREALRLAGVDGRAPAASGVTIRAPIDGVVLELMASPSARVEAAAPLARIAAPEPLWLEIQLPLRDAARVAPDALVTLNGSEQTARIIATASQVSADSQTVILRALLPNRAQAIKPGQFFTVSVPATAASSGRLWQVPTAALVRLDDTPVVFVRDGESFRTVPVQVREASGEHTVVSGDIAADAAIVVRGATALKAVASGVGSTGSP